MTEEINLEEKEVLEEKIEEENKNIAMGNLYHLNKTIVEQNEKVLSPYKLEEKKQLVRRFLNETSDDYYMLLSNERHDYTIFRNTDKSDIEKTEEIINILVDECLVNRGGIKGIEYTEDKSALEIWISIDNESFVYYFFPYGTAIIEV